jgi:aryl-alcohol dehydrogenase-like predicted oxidoreductase
MFRRLWITGAMSRERIANLPDDDWRKSHPDFQEPQLSRNLKLVKLVRAIGRLHRRTPAEVAVAWVLQNPTVTGAIVGARRPGQVWGVAEASYFRFTPREVGKIEAVVAKAAA